MKQDFCMSNQTLFNLASLWLLLWLLQLASYQPGRVRNQMSYQRWARKLLGQCLENRAARCNLIFRELIKLAKIPIKVPGIEKEARKSGPCGYCSQSIKSGLLNMHETFGQVYWHVYRLELSLFFYPFYVSLGIIELNQSLDWNGGGVS